MTLFQDQSIISSGQGLMMLFHSYENPANDFLDSSISSLFYQKRSFDKIDVFAGHFVIQKHFMLPSTTISMSVISCFPLGE